MYAVIRTYTGDPELADQLAARADEVKGLVGGIAGFRGYYLVRTDEGCTTLTVYDDRTGADESSRLAADWFREHASEIKVPTPQVTRGEVLIQAAGGS